jgi:hypothetical protein
MKTVVLKDHLIEKDECLALLDEFSEFIEKHTGITCEFYVEGYDFSRVPTVPDPDGDLKPTQAYRTALNQEVNDRYGDYGVDNVVMLVHENNFTFKGIWGQNWSYIYNKHSFQLSRWDRDNSVNTFNTLYHEIAHSFDAVVLTETGVEIDDIVEKEYNITNFDWDRDFVHGNSPLFPYIGHRGFVRDGKMLKILAPYLRDAYQKRRDRQKLPLLKKIVELLSTLLRLRLKQK